MDEVLPLPGHDIQAKSRPAPGTKNVNLEVTGRVEGMVDPAVAPRIEVRRRIASDSMAG